MYVRRSQLVTCAHTSRSVIASSIDEKKRNKRREERGKITTRRSCPAPGDELMLLPLARSSCVSLSLAVYAPLVAIVSLGPSNDDAPRKRLSPESTFWSWRLDCQPSGSRFFSVGPSTLYCLSLSLSLSLSSFFITPTRVAETISVISSTIRRGRLICFCNAVTCDRDFCLESQRNWERGSSSFSWVTK